jgi:protoheme IX farnesyltransferase
MNQVLEADYDKLMHRTRNRPLASGRLSKVDAVAFASGTGLASLSGLYLAFGAPTAAVAASTIGMYVGVYTPMKRRTGYNTHVGAIAGALPVLMGYTAAGCSLLTPQPWALFAFQTLWQFPHFYALAWLHREDYTRGGFKMFPMTMTGEETAQLIKPYFGMLAVLPLATCAAGATSPMFVVDMWVLTGLFYKPFRTFEQKPSNATARKFFLASIWYLGAGFLALMIHSSPTEDDWRVKTRRFLRGICVHAALLDDITGEHGLERWLEKTPLDRSGEEASMWSGAVQWLSCPVSADSSPGSSSEAAGAPDEH